MTDEDFDPQLDALLRDAARTYNRPPDFPETESLWAAIDQALPAGSEGVERPRLTVVRGEVPSRRRLLANPWLRTAAVLLLGVALGRVSTRVSVRAGAPSSTTTTSRTPTAARQPDASAGERTDADRVATTEYLGRTEALLAALPAELEARRGNPAYHSQADALLLQTRLLMDSPAAADPALRSLFDDLELVLAQVVRLHADRDRTRVELLQQSLEQRDVLPRLRDAVADNAAD
jgi:hypothetical protein